MTSGNMYQALFFGMVMSMSGAMQAAAPTDVNRVDIYGWTPLMHAASQGNVSEVEKLIAAGATVNYADEFGLTPLMEASKGGHKEVVALLLDADASKSENNCNGETAADIAQERHRFEVSQMLASGRNSKAAGRQ